ncbi:EamA family transporter [Microbacterium ulmi]|uniref:EamA family transporter n=1 Tax=Microbacterium ulmi TaxID=179095 RepID=A0A7Y2M3A5_9MICO|nr:EamA family transporter [Microbacterium ulmi]NII68544.1 drug/metabolite transporter (DMT)-like permease [Microbacterium ulmi]NNH05417.1 EamA family transporter [Microbacterium ulmi]
MLSAALALVGALVYGSADFLGGLAAKRLRSIVVTAVAAVAGLGMLLLAFPFIGGEWRPADIAWGALSGATGAVAIVLLYACLAIGPMSILSPLTAVVSAIAPILWGLIVDGESLSPIAGAGLGVALVAVVLVGFVPGDGVVRPSVRGLAMAIGAGLAIGAFLIIIDQTSDESGLVPLLLNRAVNGAITFGAVGVLARAAVRAGRTAASVLEASGDAPGATQTGHADLEHASARIALSRTRAWWLAAGCGVLDAAANVLLLLALRAGDLSIVSALTAMYPAGTILLAAVVLRERIAAVQWLGLVLALTAGVMLAVA